MTAPGGEPGASAGAPGWRDTAARPAPAEDGFDADGHGTSQAVSATRGLDWAAPLIEVDLSAELPFWLLAENATIPVEVGPRRFEVRLRDNYFELYAAQVTDSRATVLYRGPLRPIDQLGDRVRELHAGHPELPMTWRKCKTVLEIPTHCNSDVWRAAVSDVATHRNRVSLYLAALCRAHLPVANKLVQGYRLGTYDNFAFELTQWDVPRWLVDHEGTSVGALLVPYRGWDVKPPSPDESRPGAGGYRRIDARSLQAGVETVPSPGELELLDAVGLLERGDYSGAVRRITTAVEVIVEAALGDAIRRSEGIHAARDFLRRTHANFPARVIAYERLSERALPDEFREELMETRRLRHRIVHGGHRLTTADSERARRAVAAGRWVFNWFEDNPAKLHAREALLGYPGAGAHETGFRVHITADGVVLLPVGLETTSPNATG